MRRLFTEPLIAFLAIGLGLFGLFRLVSPPDSAPDDRTIVVDREALLTFVQYRSRAFEPEFAATQLDSMSDEERRQLIEDYVREEALHREALALGMDANDYVIKQRLIQKVRFINTGFATAAADPTDADVEAYFEANKSDYYIDPFVTFTHVFFDSERHGRERARALAVEKLAELERDRVPFSESPRHGDRFLYHINYVERNFVFVASHFGESTAQRIFELEPSDERWYGPLESPYGFHLVMLTSKREGRFPDIDEIAERVRDDTRREQIRARSEEALREIVDTYDVRIEYSGSGRQANR